MVLFFSPNFRRTGHFRSKDRPARTAAFTSVKCRARPKSRCWFAWTWSVSVSPSNHVTLSKDAKLIQCILFIQTLYPNHFSNQQWAEPKSKADPTFMCTPEIRSISRVWSTHRRHRSTTYSGITTAKYVQFIATVIIIAITVHQNTNWRNFCNQ